MTEYEGERKCGVPVVRNGEALALNGPTFLRGNFDLVLESACSFHCEACCFLDVLGDDERRRTTLHRSLSRDEVRTVAQRYIDLNLAFDSFTLLGGEPTLHPEILEIIDDVILLRGRLFRRARIVTNMTRLSTEILKAISQLDDVILSVYPLTRGLFSDLESSGLLEWLRARTTVTIWVVDEFELYGVPNPAFPGVYSREENWGRCQHKYECRVVDGDSVWFCHRAHELREPTCPSGPREVVIDYLGQTAPLEICGGCPMPPKTAPWKSREPERDERMNALGRETIRRTARDLGL